MAFTSPGSLRSPRKQALAMGTAPGTLSEGVAYDSNAGVPSSMAGGHYQTQGPFVTASGSPINTTTPFALSGGGSK